MPESKVSLGGVADGCGAMTQPPLFDIAAGRAARDRALARFESLTFVTEARQTAFGLVKRQGFVTTDDLHELYPEVPSGNYWGAVLRHPYFFKIGEMQSKRPEAHGRNIHKWILGPEWRRWEGSPA